jgi:plastocyanin
MKKFFTLGVVVLLFTFGRLFATTDTIKTVGFAFVPPVLDANIGDTVVFSLMSPHNAVQVDPTTWALNGTTSNGGFSFTSSGGKLVITAAGVYYYVCQPHVASHGMKGMIIVVGLVNIASTQVDAGEILKVYPNPANEFINANFTVPENSRIKIDLIDMVGRVVGNLLVGDYSQGNYKSTFTLSNYPDGRYFIRYIYGGTSIVKPIVINRLR